MNKIINYDKGFLQLLDIVKEEFGISLKDMRNEYKVLQKLESDTVDKDIEARELKGEDVLDENGAYITTIYCAYVEINLYELFVPQWINYFRSRYWTEKAVEKTLNDLSTYRLVNAKELLAWIDSDGKEFPKITRFLLLCDYIMTLMFDFLKSIEQSNLDNNKLDT